jgi:hypothetical protein
VGAFAKETALMILIGWVVVHSLRDRRNLIGLLWTLPAVLVYAAAQRLFPGPLNYTYYQPSYMLEHALAVFNPGFYNGEFLANMVLSQLPLLVAGVVWLYFRFAGRDRPPTPDAGLLLFPLLLWASLTLGLGTNSGRFVFMAFPAFMLFQAQMLQEVWNSRQSGSWPPGTG